MPTPQFVVPVADIEKADQSLSWDISPEWLGRNLAETEAEPSGGPGQLSAQLSMNGPEVLVRGRVKVEVTMPCARTMDPVNVEISSDLYLLLSRGRGSPRPTKNRRGRGKNSKAIQDLEHELSAADAARDTFEGDRVVLDEFVREHILLELPMVVLRSDLRSGESAANGPPSLEKAAVGPSDPARSSPPAPPNRAQGSLDPRWQPLAEIAKKMREKTNKE